MENKISLNTNRKNLLQLVWLRLIAVVGQVFVILATHYFLKISLPLEPMFLVVAALLLVNFFSFFFYKSQKKITDQALFCQLLFDVAALTAQLYFSGGISNPFISLFLLQVIISAILLKRIYACAIGAITIACYVWLSFNNQELCALHHHSEGDFLSLHLQGMLVSYIFAAILLLIFVTKIIANLNDRDRQILEEEKLVKIALVATGAAHELSTPLSTISVILNDLKTGVKKEFLEEIEIAQTQLNRCKNILSNVLLSSESGRFEKAEMILAKQAFDGLVEGWGQLRNPQNLIYDFAVLGEKKIIFDESLKQAFFNILDNAFEASPNWICLKVKNVKNEIVATITDQGQGFDSKILPKIGQENVTNKGGNGLGLFLAINALRRIGGGLAVKNLKNGGAQVEVKFPILK
ncbi:MAG: HAMP domain-containing histidine kinase [Rickettsiales bacterium]|nr:HAMP domain-containing histidine kinase [Rickettsiales bacterium]